MRDTKWSPREDALLRELTMQGVPVKEIAQRLGRTRAAVNSRVYALKNKEPARVGAREGSGSKT